MKSLAKKISLMLFGLLLTQNLWSQANDDLPKFERVTEHAGITRDHKNIFGNPIWGDMNNDGLLDVIVPHHAFTPDIYLNNGDGSFQKRHVIVTFGQSYFSEWNDFHGYSFTDFNNDGILDVHITVGAMHGNPAFNKRDLLYRGMGNARFELVSTVTGVENPSGRGRSSCWFDHDNDGHLDFLQKNIDMPNALFLNSGNETFTDIATSVGLRDILRGAVCSLADYDNDGLLDILLTAGGAHAILLRRMASGEYQDVTAEANLSSDNAGSAAAWGDYDNDGFLDLFISSAVPNTFDGAMSNLNLANRLYHNNGDGTFTEVTESAGLGGNVNTPAAAWGDLNNDGLLDLVVTAAGEPDGSGNQIYLYLNNGNGQFSEQSELTELAGRDNRPEHRYSTIALADYDNDGSLDVLVDGGGIPPIWGMVELYRNQSPNNYLKLYLQGKTSNAPGIGSRISVTANGYTQTQQHTGATLGARFSQSIQPLHFGLGQATRADIIIQWPSGTTDIINNIAPNQSLSAVENRSIAYGLPLEQQTLGCYVWKLTNTWSLLCRGPADRRVQFRGTIRSSADGAFTQLRQEELEANDLIVAEAHEISFTLNARAGFDIIRFQSTASELTFDIYEDGVPVPEHLYIGEQGVIPAALPLVLSL